MTDSCPGVDSTAAGKSDACQGCPNKEICSTNKKEDTLSVLPFIARNTQGIKKRVLVLSGKGGVGKSSVASQLACLLAAESAASKIGVLDADICGPSQPRMFGIECMKMSVDMNSTMSPVFGGNRNNIAIVSTGLLVDDNQPIIWRGPKKTGIIQSFLKDVEWDDLDYLIIDTPPGTSDEHLAIVNMLQTITGAILVTGPQEISWQDVRKEIDFCRRLKIPILCVFENMNQFTCSHCSSKSEIFPAKSSHIQKFTEENGIAYIRCPLEIELSKNLDKGVSYVDAFPTSEATASFARLVDLVKRA